jgi:NHL repeat
VDDTPITFGQSFYKFYKPVTMKSFTLFIKPLFHALIAASSLSIAFSSCCSKTIVVTTHAGSGASGNADGRGIGATFAQPNDVAVDGKGNVYVADKGNNSIRLIKPNGTVSLHYYWAARPSGGFVEIEKLDADKNGKLFVIDGDNLSIRKVEGDASPTITGFRHDDEFYYQYRSVDGAPDSASFFHLKDITLNSADDLLYVIDDTPINDLVRRVTLAGHVTTPAGYATTAPAGYSSITMDADNNIFVAFGWKVIKITATGTVVDFAGGNTLGYADGLGTAARFNGITSIDADEKGNVYVADNGNNRIRKISATGEVTTIAGNGTAGFADGPGASAQFKDLQGIAVYKCVLFVADRGNNRIRRVSLTK